MIKQTEHALIKSITEVKNLISKNRKRYIKTTL